MPKVKKPKRSQAGKVSLEDDIESATFARPKNRNKIRLRKDEDEQFVDSNLSRKILSAAREQQRELSDNVAEFKAGTSQWPALDEHDSDSDSDESEVGSYSEDMDVFYENLQVNEEDERAIERFMSSNPAPRRNLADIIAKSLEKRTEIETQFSETESVNILPDIDPRLVEYWGLVGETLKKYRSGKIPKALKNLPSLMHWEQFLAYTNPPGWSAAAMYQATRIFASKLKDHEAEVFYSTVLLPRIRDDLTEYKRLNFHLYQALKKAMYKPRAFVKGIVLSLLESGDCNLREAIIVGSTLVKNSFPPTHAAVAIRMIADMDYTGANSIMLRILFDKKYNLPISAVDAVCQHFVKFRSDHRELPVLWHQALLTFVQRYKHNLESDYRDNLLQLLTKHKHHSITPEIRRELQNAVCRDPVMSEPK